MSFIQLNTGDQYMYTIALLSVEVIYGKFIRYEVAENRMSFHTGLDVTRPSESVAAGSHYLYAPWPAA